MKMISTKCDKCKYKAWCWNCVMCQNMPFICFVCNETISHRERHDHMDIYYNDPNQYLISRKCKVNKHISHYEFKHFLCRLCLYLKKF